MNSNKESSASELRSRLDEITERTTVLESQIALLQKERESVLKDLAAVVYPVLTLPDDITSEIFLKYVDDSVHGPLPLASVCRLWRVVALSTCSLWTHLSSRSIFYPACVALANLLQCYLPRAGSLPLDLHIKLPPSSLHEPDSDTILRVLGQHSSRWRSLELIVSEPLSFPSYLYGSFSSLTKFSLENYSLDFGPTIIPPLGDAALLREVRLEAIDLPVDWRTSLPWMQLTNLELVFSTVDQCLDILEHTPTLEVLVFTSEVPGSPPDPTTFPTCSLHRLHTITLASEYGHTLLNYLTLPALVRIDLPSLTEECAEELEPLIARSGCAPRVLDVYLFEPDMAPITACIWSLPSLREVRMVCPGAASDDFTRLFDIINDPSILPALESLAIDDCRADIELGPLDRLLSARASGKDGAAKLISFTLSFNQDCGGDGYAVDMQQHDEDVELALDRIRNLRRQGLKVDIRSSFKWLTHNLDLQMIKEIGADNSP
ncbi:hypothetical protein B0H11DRAFT_929580 [Mycena galericulata]|nr:hypothetical protein B0H11DRAFT_929580 [Mycena galericulata]